MSASIVAMACVCSHVLTTTASNSWGRSKTLRKSTNLRAWGCCSAARSRFFSFTSHSATMFSEDTDFILPPPRRPADDGDVQLVVQAATAQQGRCGKHANRRPPSDWANRRRVSRPGAELEDRWSEAVMAFPPSVWVRAWPAARSLGAFPRPFATEGQGLSCAGPPRNLAPAMLNHGAARGKRLLRIGRAVRPLPRRPVRSVSRSETAGSRQLQDG